MRACKRCGVEKSFDGFYKTVGCIDGIRPICKTCTLDDQRIYIARPDKAERKRERQRVRDLNRLRPTYTRETQLLRTYNLTMERHDEILAAQGGVCGSCGALEPGGKGTWYIDHDHLCCSGKRSCGECVRGLLCALCNPMLGFAKDSIERLEAGIAYLRATAQVS